MTKVFNSSSPTFDLSDLTPGRRLTLEVSAWNCDGVSRPATLTYTPPSATSRRFPTVKTASSWTPGGAKSYSGVAIPSEAVILGLVLTLTTCFVALLCCVKMRCCRRRPTTSQNGLYHEQEVVSNGWCFV